MIVVPNNSTSLAHTEILVLLEEHGWHKTRIKTCAHGATYEGKPVKQVFQVIAPLVCTHSEQEHVQKL
eukprot:1681688-Amphidinium_carterae.1